MDFRTQYDAVIVGGGHNGLVAASYLAHAGLSVLLLERNDALGGASVSEAVFPGMDARLSRYSYLVSLLPRAIVDELGLDFSTRRRAIGSCTPYEQEGRPGALLISNVDEGRSRASFLERADDADWGGYQALLELEQAIAARVWPSLLEPLRSREQWRQALSSPLERAAWEAIVERPLGEVIERHVRDDLMRGVLLTDGKIGIHTHAHDESLHQNRCFLFHVIGNGTGEWQVPIGGMGALAAALAASAALGGAQLVAGATVDTVHPGSARHAVAFRHQGREHTVEATRVLVNAGPQVFAQLLGEGYAPTPADEGSVCKVNMLLRRLPRLKAGVDPREAFAGTLHIDESYGQLAASFDQADRGELPERPPAEIYCHTLTDSSILGPELRDAGYHTLTLFGLDAPYRLFERDHDDRRAKMLRRYLDGLDRILAEPIEECLATDANGEPCIEIKTPQDLEGELALNRGNIFHSELSWFFADEQGQVGAWGVETQHPRIYRCGSAALRGGAVSGIPGRNAARCIFEELGRS